MLTTQFVAVQGVQKPRRSQLRILLLPRYVSINTSAECESVAYLASNGTQSYGLSASHCCLSWRLTSSHRLKERRRALKADATPSSTGGEWLAGIGCHGIGELSHVVIFCYGIPRPCYCRPFRSFVRHPLAKPYVHDGLCFGPGSILITSHEFWWWQ